MENMIDHPEHSFAGAYRIENVKEWKEDDDTEC